MKIALSNLINLIPEGSVSRPSQKAYRQVLNPQKHHHVSSPSFPQRLYNKARAAGYIRPSMSSDFRLISHATQRNPLEWSIQSFRDRLSKRCFTRTRRPDKPCEEKKLKPTAGKQNHATYRRMGPLTPFLPFRPGFPSEGCTRSCGCSFLS